MAYYEEELITSDLFTATDDDDLDDDAEPTDDKLDDLDIDDDLQEGFDSPIGVEEIEEEEETV